MRCTNLVEAVRPPLLELEPDRVTRVPCWVHEQLETLSTVLEVGVGVRIWWQVDRQTIGRDFIRQLQHSVMGVPG